MASDPSVTLAAPAVQMAFACESFATDPFGRPSFHTIVDTLMAPSFPATTAQLVVMFGFIGALPGFLVKCRMAIESQSGDIVRDQTIQDLVFKPDAPIARAFVVFQGVTWPAPGEYVVKFYGNDRTLAWFPIRVVEAAGVPQEKKAQ